MAGAADSDDPPKTQIPPPADANPRLTHFMYKAFLVTVFLVLVPLFPSLAPPDFIHATSWEVLQLVFVGIAVSYGLFSKKNDNKDHIPSSNPQSYVSKLLQVSSVFEDESETLIEEEEEEEHHKFQTVNSSQYSRGQPPVVVVVAPKQQENGVSEITQKPLLLPVRSLNDYQEEEESNGGKSVLPSPIPWRSRSGGGELSNRITESRSFRSPSRSIRRVSPSTSESPRKKGGAVPPPPPPPPPPQTLRKSVLMKSNSTIAKNADPRDKEVLRRSVSSLPESELSRRGNLGMKELIDTDGDSEGEIEEDDEFMEADDDDDGGPDVDKKADEFIAKFREQIRLQRIESIRKSTSLPPTTTTTSTGNNNFTSK